MTKTVDELSSPRLRELLFARAEYDREIQRERESLRRLGAIYTRFSGLLGVDPGASVRVVNAVASSFGCEPEDILGPSRMRTHADARAVVAHILRSFDLTLVAIGRVIERDHTTVLAACRRVEDDHQLRTVAVELRAVLASGSHMT